MHTLKTFWKARSWPNRVTLVMAALAFVAIGFITAAMLLAAGHAPKEHLEAVLIRGAVEIEFLVTLATWVAANLVWATIKAALSAYRFIRKMLKVSSPAGLAKHHPAV
jgi:hypothetical protein